MKRRIAIPVIFGALLVGACGSGAGSSEFAGLGEGGSGSEASLSGGSVGLGSGGLTTGVGTGGVSTGGVGTGGASTGGDVGTGGTETGGASTGGVGTGGASTGGASTGGSSGTGGSAAKLYACDGTTTGYDVVVSGGGTSWTVSGGGQAAANANSIAAAMAAGFGRLSAGRTTKATMLVQGNGSMAANTRISLPSYIVLNLCGTINVTGTGSGDQSPFYVRGRTDVEIPHATITGSPAYGMFFRETSNVHLGEIVLNLDPASTSGPGIGIRIDNSSNAGAGGTMVTNIAVDHLTASETPSHAMETYGVDGLVVGRVDATNTGESGLLLNRTINADVGVVHCQNCGAGTGYAAFRIANNAGKIGTNWPAGNIHVAEVYARSGGRGIFSVSGSGGLTIDKIDLSGTGNNPILLQNCINTKIAAKSGTIVGGGVVLSNDTTNTNNGTFIASQNVTLSNLALSGGATMTEAWCQLGDRGNRAVNITGAVPKMCF